MRRSSSGVNRAAGARLNSRPLRRCRTDRNTLPPAGVWHMRARVGVPAPARGPPKPRPGISGGPGSANSAKPIRNTPTAIAFGVCVRILPSYPHAAPAPTHLTSRAGAGAWPVSKRPAGRPAAAVQINEKYSKVIPRRHRTTAQKARLTQCGLSCGMSPRNVPRAISCLAQCSMSP